MAATLTPTASLVDSGSCGSLALSVLCLEELLVFSEKKLREESELLIDPSDFRLFSPGRPPDEPKMEGNWDEEDASVVVFDFGGGGRREIGLDAFGCSARDEGGGGGGNRPPLPPVFFFLELFLGVFDSSGLADCEDKGWDSCWVIKIGAGLLEKVAGVAGTGVLLTVVVAVTAIILGGLD